MFVLVAKNVDSTVILEATCKKFCAYDHDLTLNKTNSQLVYPDGTVIDQLPETDDQFTLPEY